MMLGHEKSLDTSEQFLIATWAVKTAIVFEATLSPEDDNFSQAERQIVMREDRPPASVEISLSAVIGPIAPVSYACAKVGAVVGDDIRMRFHFHTVQAGALVLNILRRDPPPANYGSLERFAVPQELDVPFGVVRAIFPPVTKTATWPPGELLDWDGFMKLSLRGMEIPDEWKIPEEFMPTQEPPEP